MVLATVKESVHDIEKHATRFSLTRCNVSEKCRGSKNNTIVTELTIVDGKPTYTHWA